MNKIRILWKENIMNIIKFEYIIFNFTSFGNEIFLKIFYNFCENFYIFKDNK